MTKVIVQVDWYTKIILTLIAVLLAGLLAKSYIDIKVAQAYYDEPQRVLIVNNWRDAIPVNIRGDVSVYTDKHSLDVNIISDYSR